jgi:putative toxin-antitoxin system antitoxin component (TIGR02293 family)
MRGEVIAAAVELFEGDAHATEVWLNTPLRAIGHETPLDYMDTAAKIHTLRNVIGRLEHGVWN